MSIAAPNPSPAPRHQSLGEEIANSVSHGVGLLAALVATPFLIASAVARGDAAFIAGACVFALSMVALYGASMVYHALPRNRAKQVAQLLDHGAIFLLIAGTYTPFTLGEPDHPASTPRRNKPSQFAQRQLAPGGPAVVALVGSARCASIWRSRRVHFVQREAAVGAHGAVAGHGGQQFVAGALDHRAGVVLASSASTLRASSTASPWASVAGRRARPGCGGRRA
jgi:hypothetical protein